MIVADNLVPPARAPKQFQLSVDERRAVDAVMFGGDQLMVLGINNQRVRSLTAFTNRRIGVWEGQTREDLSRLVEALTANKGNAEAIGNAVVTFVNSISAGFSMSTHGERLLDEIRENCIKTTTGKPAAIQAMAKLIVADANHSGVARALKFLADYVERKEKGFADVKIDHKTEFAEAVRLEAYATPEDGFAELARRRVYFRRSPPQRVLSTIHKAKGLECANAMVIPCDSAFSGTYYSKCRLYVAISRASHALTLVVPSVGGSPLLKKIT